MAYGKIKADAIIRDNGGTDEEITMATIVSLDSDKASLTGATFTGDVILDNEQELRLSEADANGANYVALKAPATLAQTSTWTMPADVPTAGQVLKVTSVSTNDPTLEWGTDAEGADITATNTWTAAQRAEITNIDSSSGVLAINFDDSNSFLCITTENITDINYTDLDADMVGQTGSIFFQYGGAHTVGGWDTETRWIGGTGGANNAPTFTATSGQLDRVDYIIVGDRDTPTDRAHVRVQMVASLNYAD
jgi:hypothetical protein